MPTLTIDLDRDLEKAVHRVAGEEAKTDQEVCLDAVRAYIEARPQSNGTLTDADFEPLRKMIGLVEHGPKDGSTHHDYRPGDPL